MGEPRASSEAERPLYFPNKMGRILLLAMEEAMGRNGVTALLNLVNLRRFLEHYPPNDFEMNFSFAESSRLLAGLDEMYGLRGARGLALRIGQACFRLGIKDMGPMLGVADLAFRVMPLTVKLRIGFDVFAQLFNKFSDHHVRVEEEQDHFLWIIDQCGVCWGRSAPAPACYLAVGILQEALYWVSGGASFAVQEIACLATGDSTCTIQIDKEPY